MVPSAGAAPEAHIFIYHLPTSIQKLTSIWGHSFYSQLCTGPDLFKELSDCMGYFGMHVGDPVQELREPPGALC